MQNFPSNFARCADQTYLGIAARWHFLRFCQATGHRQVQREIRERRRNAKKKMLSKKKEKKENIQWNYPGWKDELREEGEKRLTPHDYPSSIMFSLRFKTIILHLEITS